MDPRVPRVVDTAPARILRESITHVLKHGGRGTVEISIHIRPDSATMTIRSPLPPRVRREEFLSGGYGIMRMTACARQLGGKLHSGPIDDEWRGEAHLPLG